MNDLFLFFFYLCVCMCVCLSMYSKITMNYVYTQETKQKYFMASYLNFIMCFEIIAVISISFSALRYHR